MAFLNTRQTSILRILPLADLENSLGVKRDCEVLGLDPRGVDLSDSLSAASFRWVLNGILFSVFSRTFTWEETRLERDI